MIAFHCRWRLVALHLWVWPLLFICLNLRQPFLCFLPPLLLFCLFLCSLYSLAVCALSAPFRSLVIAMFMPHARRLYCNPSLLVLVHVFASTPCIHSTIQFFFSTYKRCAAFTITFPFPALPLLFISPSFRCSSLPSFSVPLLPCHSLEDFEVQPWLFNCWSVYLLLPVCPLPFHSPLCV